MDHSAFEYTGSPTRVIFGQDARQRLPQVANKLGCKRVLVLSTHFQKNGAEDLACALGDKCLGVYAKAEMHTPVEVTEAAMEVIAEQKVDGLVSFGGGSTTGLGKAIAYRTDLPQIVVPTTYAGSEVTPILGQTEGGRKVTLKSPKVLPEVVLYDPELTLTLPVPMTVTSGMNAVAHAVEALYAKNANPVASMMALEGAKALLTALPVLIDTPDDRNARAKALFGAWLCGAVLGQVGMALHHKLCHTLGGSFDLPHAETHTVVLPHATAYNEAAAGEALKPLASAMGFNTLSAGLFALNSQLGAPTALADLGMPEAGIDEAADIALSNPYWNPRALERAPIRALIARAYAGEAPSP
ncbi:MAG: maleylacetate reductase [Pseudomonadota bacterium]